jgi:hypothetical protein
MGRKFLIFSAIFEALTGLGLLFVPSRVAAILLNSVLSNPLEILLAMTAGVAISSLAFCAWMARSMANPIAVIKMLMFYNIVIAGILLYGIMALGFWGIILSAVIIFHLVLAVIAVMIYKKI